MKLSVETISREQDEEVILRCYDENAKWVRDICAVVAGEHSIVGVRDTKTFRLRLNDIYYFEVVDGRSFLYCREQVYECRLKLYEFETLSAGTMFFRSAKSMILNADKIECVRPAVSGRFEATLINGEKVIISRQYVSSLKRLLGI